MFAFSYFFPLLLPIGNSMNATLVWSPAWNNQGSVEYNGVIVRKRWGAFELQANAGT